MLFGLTGTYNSMNKGDAAMEISMCHALKSAFPGCRVKIFSPFVYRDREFYHPVEVAHTNRRNLPIGTVQFILQFVSRCRAHWTDKTAGWGGTRELRDLADVDWVIDLSGDMLTEDYGLHVAYSHFLPIMTAFASGKPVFICGQSIGPFRYLKFLARYCLTNASLVTVRDHLSADYLKQEFSEVQFVQTADLAFLLPRASEQKLDDILSGEGIPRETFYIGVSMSSLIRKHFDRSHKNTGAVFTEIIAEALDTIAQRYHLPVLFVPHVTGPGPEKDDRRIAGEIRKRMKSCTYALQGDYRPDELKAVIGCCECFLGARMHANIAALSSSVPTVAIGYSHKTSGIMAQMEQHDNVIDVRDVTVAGIIGKMDVILKNKEYLRTVLQAQQQKIIRKSELNIKLLQDNITANRLKKTGKERE